MAVQECQQYAERLTKKMREVKIAMLEQVQHIQDAIKTLLGKLELHKGEDKGEDNNF